MDKLGCLVCVKIIFVVVGSLLTAVGFLCLQLEDNLLQNITALVQDSEDPFWRKGRFLVNTGRQLASYQDGEYFMIRIPVIIVLVGFRHVLVAYIVP